MTIDYIANVRMPTEKAHGLQIMKMCEAFADLGVEVLLTVPFRFNKRKEDPFVFYNIKKNFGIKKIFSFDLMPLDKIFGRISFYAQVCTFGLGFFLRRKSAKADYIYCRDGILLPFILKLGLPVIYEAHNLSDKNIVQQKKYWGKCHRIVVISRGLEKIFRESGVPEERILVAPDGVDLREFNINETKEKCRRILNLPVDKKIVLYSGHLYDWKGANILKQVARKCAKDRNIEFLFVGGTEFDLGRFRSDITGAENIKLLGFKPHKEIPYYLKAADVLVLPNSGREAISRLYTSPLKLFEYMAAETTIVASNLPSIREILDEKSAIFFRPDDADDLAEKILYVLENYEAIKNLAHDARKKVSLYTWDRRAEKILNFINGYF